MKKALLVFAICVLAGCGGEGDDSESVTQEEMAVEGDGCYRRIHLRRRA